MPDPAESSHFGRWSECANEVLKQRALRAEAEVETAGGLELEEAEFEPVQVPEEAPSLIELQTMAGPSHGARVFARDPRIGSRGLEANEIPETRSRHLSTVEQRAAPAPARPVDTAPRPHPLDSRGFTREQRYDPGAESPVSPSPTPSPQLCTAGREFHVDCIEDADYKLQEDCQLPGAGLAPPPPAGRRPPPDPQLPRMEPTGFATRPFSSSLITGDLPENGED